MEMDYRNRFSRIVEDKKREIIDIKYRTTSNVRLRKRSGKRVGHDVIKITNRYPTHIAVYEGDEKIWISLDSENAYKYMTKEYNYQEYIDAMKEETIRIVIGLIIILIIISLLAFLLIKI